MLLFHLSPLETHLSRWPEAAGTHFPRGFISQRLERLSAKDPLDPFLSPFSPEGQERVGCIPYTCLSTALNSGAVVVGFCESIKSGDFYAYVLTYPVIPAASDPPESQTPSLGFPCSLAGPVDPTAHAEPPAGVGGVGSRLRPPLAEGLSQPGPKSKRTIQKSPSLLVPYTS